MPAPSPMRRVLEGIEDRWRAPARPLHAYAVSAALGLAVYLVVFGPSVFVGVSDYWDLPLSDHRAYLMGYRYFLHEPWHWPLFVTHTMNVPFPKSIAFSDAIPIWAFVNKAIATLIPPWGPFSSRAYLGLWYGLCHVLQPCLGVAILRALGHRSWGATIVTALFFLAIPAWTIRFVHAALFGQFLTLWAIYLYVRAPFVEPGPRRLRVVSAIQLAIAALVNPYHAVMSLGIFAASVARSRRPRTIAAWLPIGAAAVGVALWLAGYFAHEAKVHMFGFDVASSNVLTWFLPRRSGFIGDAAWIDPTGYQYEGTAYLGLGVLALLVLLLPRIRTVEDVIKRHRYLFVVAAVAGLFALSTHIYVGTHLLIGFAMPRRLHWIADQFRSPGRFSWIPMYVLVVFLVHRGLSRFASGWRTLVLPALAVLQLADVSGDWKVFRSNTRGSGGAVVPLDAWRTLIQRHDAVFVFPSYDCVLDGTPNMDQVSLELEYLASERAIPINGVYTARPTRDCARDELDAGTIELADKTLYVFLPRMARFAFRMAARGATCGEFEYGRVCSSDATAIADAIAAGIVKTAGPAPAFAYGDKLQLGSDAARVYLDRGWSWPDPTGRWSDGVSASVVFQLTGELPPSVTLKLQAASVICGRRTTEDVAVRLDGTLIGTLHFDGQSNDAAQVRTLAVPGELLRNRVVELELVPGDTRALNKVGCNADPRRLGIMIQTLWFE